MSDNLTQTYSTAGGATMSDSIREELSEIVTNVSPDETVFLSSIRNSKTNAVFTEWLEDELADPQDNAHVEGSDVDATEIKPPRRLGNYVQIFAKSFKISDTLEAVNKHGRMSEISYQTANKLKEMSRDIEKALVNNLVASDGNASTPRTLKGARGWISTNVEDFGGTPAPTNQLTEEVFNTALQQAWEQGGEPNMVLAPPHQKRKISMFDGQNRLSVNAPADARKIVNVVDIYESDFGMVRVHPHRYIDPIDDGGTLYDTILLLEQDKWIKKDLSAIKAEKMARTGLSTKTLVSTELTLEARAERANAQITNLSRTAA